MIKDLIIFNLNLSSFPMQNFNLLWRAFLAIGLIGIVTQQLFYQDFRPVIIPHWHGRLYNVQTIAVYALTILIVVLSIGMLIKRTGRIAVVILGFLLLILFMAFTNASSDLPAAGFSFFCLFLSSIKAGT